MYKSYFLMVIFYQEQTHINYFQQIIKNKSSNPSKTLELSIIK